MTEGTKGDWRIGATCQNLKHVAQAQGQHEEVGTIFETVG